MKTKLLALWCFFLFGSILTYAQYTQIPDSNFEQALIVQGIDSEGFPVDGRVLTADIAVVVQLNVSNSNIGDLSGIENFASLQVLQVPGNQLTTLDLSLNTNLITLNALVNSLNSITLNANIEELYLSKNNFSSIDLTSLTSLKELSLSDNPLTSLNLSQNNALESLVINSWPLNTIDISQNTQLKEFFGANGQLTSLDVSSNGLLETLFLGNNQIISLDLSNLSQLVYFDVENQNGNLTDLNVRNGNNANMIMMDAINNPNLACIEVDDPNNIPTSWQKDTSSSWGCAPTATITTSPVSPSAGSQFTITIEFSEDVSALDVQDIIVGSNATKPNGNSGPATRIDPRTFTTELLSTSCNDIIVTLATGAVTGTNSGQSNVGGDTTINIVDTTAPTLVLQDVTLVLDTNGQATISSTDVDNGSTDNCGIDTWSLSQLNFDCTDLGQNTVTVEAVDAAGNRTSASVTVTVEDNLFPAVLVQNITVQLDINGEVSITAADVDNGSSDSCGVSLSLDKTDFTCDDLGQNTVTLTVTDGGGNVGTRTAIVTIEENPNTQMTARTQNITVQLDANGSVTIAPSQINNGSGSGCNANPTLSLDQTTFDCSNLGQNTVTLTATDGTDTDTATAIVTVEDTIGPNLVLQDVTLELASSGTVQLSVTDVDNGSTDNCGIDTWNLSQIGFVCSELGPNTITVEAVDASGNQSTGTVTVTIVDNLAPNVTTRNITVQLDASGQAVVATSDIDNQSEDNCGIDTFSLDKSVFTCDDLGTNTVTLSATDVSGNTATATATVTVEENPNQSLTAIAQDITVQLDANGSVTISPQEVDNGSGSGCNSNPTLSLDIDIFDCSNLGVNTVTLTATEGNNTSTATATVTVEDAMAPTVTTQDITMTLDANGNAVIAPSDINNGSADNCTAMSDLTYTLDATGFDCTDVGVNIVTLTVTDAQGNSATGTATVTITENVAPTVITQDITVTLDENGIASITVDQIDNGSSDACSGIASTSLDITDFDCPDLGDITVTLTVTDNAGNTATATATITITATDDDGNNVADVCENQELIVSKGFSPNDDNNNDTWVIENIDDYPNNKVMVFNKWGEKVFEAVGYQNDWNAISNQTNANKRLAVGAYLYVIETQNPEVPPVQGWLYINY